VFFLFSFHLLNFYVIKIQILVFRAFVSRVIFIASVNNFGYLCMGFVSDICCGVLKLPFLGG
jgi:hypothetical protein